MAHLYWAIGAIVVTAVLIMVMLAAFLEFLLDPWLERRRDLRKMVGR